MPDLGDDLFVDPVVEFCLVDPDRPVSRVLDTRLEPLFPSLVHRGGESHCDKAARRAGIAAFQFRKPGTPVDVRMYRSRTDSSASSQPCFSM